MADSIKPHKAPLILQHLGTAIVLLLVPLLLLALPLPPTRGKYVGTKQDWVLGIAIAIALASAFAYSIRNPLFPGRRRVLAMILLGTSLMVVCNAVWNKAFRNYVDRSPRETHREVFRKAMHRSYHWPVYGRYDNAVARWVPPVEATKKHKARPGHYSFATLPFVLLSAGIVGGWYAWMRRRPLDRRWDAQSLAVLIAFQVALIFAFALCEPAEKPGAAPERLTLRISGYNEFKKDIPAFAGIADTLRNYVAKMPDLEWYGQHYPPGNLVLLEIEKAVHLPGLTKGLVVLLTALSVIPLAKLAEELDLDPRATSAAVLMYAATTGVLIYCTINTTSLLLFPGTVCLWMLVRALKAGSLPAAAVLGVSFFAYLCFSFSASILGVLMAVTTVVALATGAVSLKSAVRTAMVSGAVALLSIGVLYAATRFNLIACFLTAVRGHHEQQGNAGFDDATRWLLRSTGNVLAYLISTVPLCLLAAVYVVRGPHRTWVSGTVPLARIVGSATLATLLIAGFSGLFYAETERIWIFLTPFLALAAGSALVGGRNAGGDAEVERLVRRVLLLVLIVSCTQEFFFMHYR